MIPWESLNFSFWLLCSPSRSRGAVMVLGKGWGHPQALRWVSVLPSPCRQGRAVGALGWQRGGGIPGCRTAGALPTEGAASQHSSRQPCLPQPGIESLFTH